MIGRTLAHYQILDALGAGGMGEVYRAQDTKLNRQVAIKVLPEEFCKDRERLARFEREARVLASLNHPNIASIHGFEEVEGQRFLVMELVEGETLADRIARGPVPIGEALPLFVQLTEGLEAAHEKGVIHRDFKPANIKITPDDQIKILDFGLAKAFRDEAAANDSSQSPTLAPTLTKDTALGAIIGTPSYMSPEQARGKPVDTRADVWAFGCCLYEALCGKAAFLGETVSDTLAAVLNNDPDWSALPAGTPVSIRRLLRRALNKDVKRRLHAIGDARLEIDDTEAADAVTDVDSPARRWLPLGMAMGAALVASIASWTLLPRSGSSGTSEVTRLDISVPSPIEWTELGVMLALSPDGRRLVFEADDMLYVREMDAPEAKPLPGTEGGYGPFFSPDGAWLGFFTTSQLKKLSMRGGTPTTLANVSKAKQGVWTFEDDIVFAMGGPTGIMTVPASGGSHRPLTTLIDDEIDHNFPTEVLPDGEHLLFGILTTDVVGWDAAQVVAQSLLTGERKVLLEGGAQARYVSTGHLVYARAGALLAVRFDLERLEVSGEPTVVLDGVRHPLGAQFHVTRDGTLAYIGSSADGGRFRRLVWVDRLGREQPLALEPRNYFHPRISPDGTRVATSVADQDLNIDVRVYDLERATLVRRLTTFLGHDWSPSWTPDGARVFYVSDVDSGVLSWHAVDGTDEGRVVEAWRAPQSWSPDGALLTYIETNSDTGRDIGVMSVADKSFRELFATEFTEDGPAVSPNGRFIAFSSTESDRGEVYVSPFPNVEENRWQISRDGGVFPAWSPDGTELFFLNEGAMMVASIDEEPSFAWDTPQVLFEGDHVTQGLFGRPYDVAADGQRFLMLKRVDSSPSRDIHIVLNWHEELKRLVPPDN